MHSGVKLIGELSSGRSGTFDSLALGERLRPLCAVSVSAYKACIAEYDKTNLLAPSNYTTILGERA